MRRMQLLLSALLLVLLLVACAPRAAPAPAPQSPAAAAPAQVAPLVVAAPGKPAWEVEWEKVVMEAKKEGKVLLVANWRSDVVAALGRDLKKTYGIKIEHISGRSSELNTKVLAERRVGLYLWDIGGGGTTSPYTDLEPVGALISMDPYLILPEVTDPQVIKKIWYRGELWWVDSDHYILAAQMFPYPPLAVNTNLVKPEEIKSYNDLLEPKWKGKLTMDDPTMPGNTFGSFTKHTLGLEWVRKLAQQEPNLMRDQRLEVEWLARGKIPLLIGPRAETYFDFKGVGAPVQSVTAKEGGWLSAASSGIRVFQNPAHPNAAKVFINWFLSKEAQTIFSREYGGQSAREDVPTDFLPPEAIRQPGVKYWEKERKAANLQKAEDIKMFKEIFAPLIK